MLITTLSDPAGSRDNDGASQREAAFQSGLAQYGNAVAARQGRIQAHKNQLADAWTDQALLRVVGSLARLGMAHFSAKPEVPTKRAADHQELRWLHGKEGERRLEAYLASQLDNGWTLVCGYRNARGEIDQVLVGPFGVIAFEVKYINGVVHGNGDQWWTDKYDRYGNLVESGKPLGDRSGRSPSRQLNESADQLEWLLRQRCSVHRIARVVVLSHDASRIGQFSNVTVDLVALGYRLNLNPICEASNDRCDSQAVSRIVETMGRDHQYHLRPMR